MEQEPGAAYRGYTAYDRHYEKVGRVDDLFVDEHDRAEYIGVKMGLFGTKSTLIPIELVRVNDRRNLVEIDAEHEAIRHAPTFQDDKDITAEYEHGVRGYFDLEHHEPVRGAYGGYYASDRYAEEDLRRSVDTEYGERTDRPEGAPSGASGPGRTDLDAPLAHPGHADTGHVGTGHVGTGHARSAGASQPPQDETAQASEDLLDADAATRRGAARRDEVEVREATAEDDREIRVFKRARPQRG